MCMPIRLEYSLQTLVLFSIPQQCSHSYSSSLINDNVQWRVHKTALFHFALDVSSFCRFEFLLSELGLGLRWLQKVRLSFFLA